MGVWGRLTSVFAGGNGGHQLRRGVEDLAPDDPVILRWCDAPDGPTSAPRSTNGNGNGNGTAEHDAPADAATEDHAPHDHPSQDHAPHDIVARLTPRRPSRQEIIDELRGNYAEVVGLVRRVSEHLDAQTARADAQDRRAEHLTELAARMPEALAALPQIRDQNERLALLTGRMADAITDLAAATRDGQRCVEQAIAEQTRATLDAAERAEALLARIAEAQERSAELHQRSAEMQERSAELQLRSAEAHQRSLEAQEQAVDAQHKSAASLGELGSAVNASSDRLGGMFTELQHRAGERDAHLARMVARGQRWLILAMALCISAIIIAGVAVAMILL